MGVPPMRMAGTAMLRIFLFPYAAIRFIAAT